MYDAIGYTVNNEEKANEAVEFIKALRQHQGKYAGKPLKLAYWQELIIRNIFGFPRP